MVRQGNRSVLGAAVAVHHVRAAHLLWTCNREHLGLPAGFVAAGLCERGPGGGYDMSMIEKLPAWMKSARNRGDVLAAIAGLQDTRHRP